MEFKDYYKIIGVSEDAASEDIKKAYRKLARKYHPDVSKEADAKTKFQEVGEAYEVLKDAEKRKAYDDLRKGGYRGGERFTPPPGWDFGGQQDFQGGTEGYSDFFENLFGGGFQRGGRRGFARRGEDMQYHLDLGLEEAYQGGAKALSLSYQEPNAQGQMLTKTKSLNVKIPAGITSGQQIRLQGQGGPGMGNAPAGDLYLEIKLKPHALYQVEGKNILVMMPVTPWEAALGASITVPTLSGKVKLNIPAGSQTGNTLRLKGKGMPGKTAGDQLVSLKIVAPKAETEEQKAQYQALAKLYDFNPRASFGG